MHSLAFKDPVAATRAGAIYSRFKDLFSAKTDEEFLNIFHLLEYQIYGEKKNLTNQLELVSIILDMGELEEGHPGEKIFSKISTLGEIENIINMHAGKDARLFSEHKLSCSHVTWEDTARNHNSCWGPNISDLSIQMDFENRKYNLPVIRSSNFTDKTADIDPDKFMVAVGNAKKDGVLEQKSLAEILKEPWKLLTDESKWPKDTDGNPVKLYADGVDKKILVSSQMCLIPLPKNDISSKITYRPKIFNYQSTNINGELYPSVLTLMVTREGTSLDVLGRESYGGQLLSLNKAGERAPLTAKRPDEIEKKEMKLHEEMGLTAQDNSAQHNRVLIIQIPLTPKKKPITRSGYMAVCDSLEVSAPVVYYTNTSGSIGLGSSNPSASLNIGVLGSDDAKSVVNCIAACAQESFGATTTDCLSFDERDYERAPEIRERGITINTSSITKSAALRRKSAQTLKINSVRTIEKAVIGSGEVEGEYNEELGNGWERDTTLPIRVTVQLMMATSAGKITPAQVQQAADELRKVYDNADRVGSLVVG